MNNAMKAEGYRAVARDIKAYGYEYARNMAHALILDSNITCPDPYTEGYVNGFNKASKKS